MLQHGFACTQFVQLILTEIANFDRFGRAPLAVQQLKPCTDGLDQSCFALPVRADDDDAVVVIEAEVDFLEDRLAINIAEVSFIQLDQG